MIKIDVNLQYLTDNYNIGTQQLKMYRGKSLKEIMELEAKNGNYAASNFNINMFSNPMELVRVFQLMNPENRYQIISNMCYTDKMKLMAMLEKGEMLMGLRFFQKDKLLQMLEKVDKEKLFNVVLQKFSLEDFMKMIPEEFQDKFFDQKKVTPAKIMKGVQYLEPEKMARMIENVTGVPQQGKDKKELMQTMTMMKPEVFKDAVKSLEQEEKAFVMYKMIQDDPKIIQELDTQAFLIPLAQLQKNDLIESMGVLEEEDLLGMLSELTDDLMAVTATQLDPEKFAQMLATDFADILGDIGANI